MIFTGTDEQRVALFSSLAQASAEFTSVANDTKAMYGNRSFTYASLDTLIACTRPALAAHGLFVLQDLSGPIQRVAGARKGPLRGESEERGREPAVQATAVDESEVHVLTTSILHDEGGVLSSTIEYYKPLDVKVWGAYTTYLRRYAYRSIFGLDGSDDPDGGEQRPQERRNREPPAPSAPKPPPPDMATDDDMKALGAAARARGLSAKADLDEAFEAVLGQGLFEPDGRPRRLSKSEHATMLAHLTKEAPTQ
jgi:hypothetical protein